MLITFYRQIRIRNSTNAKTVLHWHGQILLISMVPRYLQSSGNSANSLVTVYTLVLTILHHTLIEGWLCVSLFIYLFICRSSRMTALSFAIILLHHAPPKVASVLVLFVILGGSC